MNVILRENHITWLEKRAFYLVGMCRNSPSCGPRTGPRVRRPSVGSKKFLLVSFLFFLVLILSLSLFYSFILFFYLFEQTGSVSHQRAH